MRNILNMKDTAITIYTLIDYGRAADEIPNSLPGFLPI